MISWFKQYQEKLESEDFEAEFNPVNDELVTIEIIGIPKKLQGQGYGSKIMRKLCSKADGDGITLQLRPSASSTHSRTKLINFYSKFGFVENKGENKNPEYQYMYRIPKYELVESILREAKQVGLLYHYTMLIHLPQIIDDDQLGEGENKYSEISFTRNKNFHKHTTIIPTEVCLVIDGDKLSNHYKIAPYQYNASHFSSTISQEGGRVEDQFEETVRGKVIKNLHQYIKEIQIDELTLDSVLSDEGTLQEFARVMDMDPDEVTGNDFLSFAKSRGFNVKVTRSFNVLKEFVLNQAIEIPNNIFKKIKAKFKITKKLGEGGNGTAFLTSDNKVVDFQTLKNSPTIKLVKQFKESILLEKRVPSKGCVMLNIDFPEMKGIQKQIKKEDLYTKEGGDSFGLEEASHVTLLYGLLKIVKVDQIKDIIEKFTFPKEIKVDSVSLFEKDEYDVLKFDVDSTFLSKVNKELKTLPYSNDYPDYKAHLTVAYLKPGKGKEYVKLFKKKEYNLKVSNCTFSSPDKDKVTINIKKKENLSEKILKEWREQNTF